MLGLTTMVRLDSRTDNMAWQTEDMVPALAIEMLKMHKAEDAHAAVC